MSTAGKAPPPPTEQRITRVSANSAQARTLFLRTTGQAPIPNPKPPIKPQPLPQTTSQTTTPTPNHQPNPKPYPKPPAKPQTQTHPNPEPTGQTPNPAPGKNAKNTAPTPRSAGPAPTTSTRFPDAVGQYPGGSRSEDDPVPVCGAGGPEVLAASSLSPIGATRSIPLSADLTDFFVIP